MNSVMDDNRLLTLPNGERIRLQPHVALLFEVGDLQYASPATVSRAGMVFVDPKNLGVKPFYIKWTKTRNEEEAALLMEFYKKYVLPIVLSFYNVLDTLSLLWNSLKRVHSWECWS